MTPSNLLTCSTAPAQVSSSIPIPARLCSMLFAWLCIISPTNVSGNASNLTACPRTFLGSAQQRNMRSSIRQRVWHETKFSLQHLIKRLKELAEAFSGKPAENKQHGRQQHSIRNRWQL